MDLLTPAMQALAGLAFLAVIALWRFSGQFGAVWDELMTPSAASGGRGLRAYARGGAFVWHAVLGAAIATLLVWLFPGAAPVLPGIIALGYWLAKELPDLGRGGTLSDGIEDAAAVWIGALYGPWWWPFTVCLAGGFAMLAGLAGGRR